MVVSQESERTSNEPTDSRCYRFAVDPLPAQKAVTQIKTGRHSRHKSIQYFTRKTYIVLCNIFFLIFILGNSILQTCIVSHSRSPMLHYVHIELLIFFIMFRSSQYLLWTLLWVGWNVFVSCLYLDLGGLSKVKSNGHVKCQIIRDPCSFGS